MISILNTERNRIENKIIADTFENVISYEKLTYDFKNKTEVINITFKSKNHIPNGTHITVLDESKNNSEFICIKSDNLNSILIPAYTKDLNNKFMSSSQELKGSLKSVIQTLLLDTSYGVEFNDLVPNDEVTVKEDKKSIYKKLLDILFEKDLSIRHKHDINTGERTLIINKGKDLRKSNPKEINGRIPGFEFNVDKSKIKTALIVYDKNSKESITVRDSINQNRFIKNDEYIFDTIEVENKTKEEMEDIANIFLNESTLKSIELKLTGLILRQWTNCHYNKFISSQIFIDYKVVTPELISGFQIYKLERSLFDYNIERFNFFANYKKIDQINKPELIDNYINNGDSNIIINEDDYSNNNDIKLLENLMDKKINVIKEYVDNITSNNSSSSIGLGNLKSNKELNFDAIISDFNIIKSQKDTVINQLKSIFDSAYLTEDSIKIQVRDKIKEIETGFSNIKSTVNTLNRADQDEELMKGINKDFVEFYSIIKSTKNIIELSNESINLEMNKLQNEYSHGIKDTVFKEIARILGLTYDSSSQILKGDINVMSDINNLKTSLDLMKNKVERIESNITESSMNLKGQLHDLVENLSNVLGLPINPDGYIDGNISNEDIINQIKKQIEDTKQEISKSKEDLALTKTELEKQQEELDQKSKDIDKAMAEANNVREDLGQELEVSQQEFNYYMDSRGDNLIFNGNADQGDESNFPGMYYDNSDAFQSAASFRMEGFNSVNQSERLIPINPEKTYKLSMFMKNNNSLNSSIGHLSYDKDGQLIESQHVMGSEKPVIELAQELRQGDKVIYFNSLDGLDDTYRFQAAPIDEEDDTPVYDYDRDGSVILPQDSDDILSIDDPNAFPDEEEDSVIYADDTPEEDATTSDEIDVPMPDSDVAVDTNSTPLDEEEAIKTMTNNYNVSNAGIVNRNINPNLTDYNDNHSLVIWNFKSNDGYNYGESSYSRNVFMNGWDFGAIDRENNCIYLNRPFDLINYDSEDGGFPAGTKVSGTFTDSNVEWSLIKDEDIPNTEEDDDPEEFNGWYHRQGLITKENIRGTNGFLYGAFYMTLYFKVNQSEDSDVIEFEDGSDEPKFWVTNLEMYDVTGLESVKKTVIDTNELVATMMTKKEMDDYRKQITEGFSEVSQTVDMIRQEVSKKITDLDDKVMTDITSRIETIAGQIDLVSQSQKVDKEELEKQIGQIKIETDKITSLVQRITATEDNYSDLSTKVEQIDSSYTITAEKVEKQGTDITDLSGKLTVANDAITQEVTDRKSAVDGVMESSKALVKVEADRITNLVSKQEATDDTVSNLETSITAEIGRIENRVTSETSVEALSDKIKIGGNNLLVGTEKFDLPFNKTYFNKYGGIIKDGIGYSLDYISESNRLAWSMFQEVNVIPNTDYILSYNAYTKEGINQGITYTPIMRLNDSGKIFDPLEYIITSGTYRETTEEDKRYNVRFNTGKSKKIRIYFTAKDVNSLAYISKPQLELGNIDTDWGLSKGDLEDRFSKAETRITQTEEDITLNATKLTETGELIEKNYSELKVETDKISSIVSEQKILDGKISANTSSIEQLPNQITSQVSAVENRVNDKIDNIQVGGRNLLRNSLSFDEYFDKPLTSNIVDIFGENNAHMSTNYVVGYLAYNANMEKFKPDTYTFTMYVKADTEFECEFGYRDNVSKTYGSFTITTEWKLITFTFTTTDITTTGRVVYWYPNGNVMYFSHPKLERGTISTDWTPAPEDIETRLVASETRITQTEKDISLNASSITTLDNKTTNQYSTLKVETDKISGIVSKQEEMDGKIATNTSSIQQLPNQITSQVSAVEKRVNENINNIQVGARNLIPSESIIGIKDGESSKEFITDGWASKILDENWVREYLKSNETYTISYEVEVVEASKIVTPHSQAVGRFYLYNGSSSTMGEIDYNIFKKDYSNGKVFKVQNTFTVPELKGTEYILIYTTRDPNNSERGSFKFRNLKLEKGNKATDWTPAPEDVTNQINGINVGGTNLVLNSNFKDDLNNWRNYGSSTIDNIVTTDDNTLFGNSSKIAIYESTELSKEKGIAQDAINVEVGKEYILSAYVKSYTGEKKVVLQQGRTSFNRQIFDITDNWRRYEYKFIADQELLNVYVGKATAFSNQKVGVCQVQLEQGNKSTQWSLAPEDINQSITMLSTKIDQKTDSIELSVSQMKSYFDSNNMLINSDLRNSMEGWEISGYSSGYYNIEDVNTMSINTDDNMIAGGRYRDDHVSSGEWKRTTLYLTRPIKKGVTYILSFDYTLLSGKNTTNEISVFPYIYPHSKSNPKLPDMSPDSDRFDAPVSSSKRNIIKFTANRDANQVLLYAAKAGTDDNANSTALFENVTMVEGKSEEDSLPYSYGSSKKVFKFSMTGTDSWPSITSNYMSIGKGGDFDIGDTITGSAYIYVPSSSLDNLVSNPYIEVATYENKSQGSNPSFARYEYLPKDFKYDEWVRVSFKGKIPSSSSNGKTNYVRFLMRFSGPDQPKNTNAKFYYGLPQLEINDKLTKWTPSRLDSFSTESMASKISMNPESIDIISNHLNINTNNARIYNDKGNLSFNNDILRISKTALDTDNFVEINSTGLNIRKNGVDQVVDGMFKGESNVQQTIPMGRSFNLAGSNKLDGLYHIQVISNANYLDAAMYKYASSKKYLTENGGTQNALLGSFSFYHDKRYLVMSFTYNTTKNANLHVTVAAGVGWKTDSKTPLYFDRKYTSASKGILSEYIDLGTPDNYNKTLVIQLGITGSTAEGEGGSIIIKRLSLSNFNSPS